MQGNLRGSLLAQKVAAAFNDPAQRGDTLASGTVRFPGGSIVVVPDPGAEGGKAAYLVEPYLAQTGHKWHKWINNDGTPNSGSGAVPEVLSAFCHFSMVHMAKSEQVPLIILDIRVRSKCMSLKMLVLCSSSLFKTIILFYNT